MMTLGKVSPYHSEKGKGIWVGWQYSWVVFNFVKKLNSKATNYYIGVNPIGVSGSESQAFLLVADFFNMSMTQKMFEVKLVKFANDKTHEGISKMTDDRIGIQSFCNR